MPILVLSHAMNEINEINEFMPHAVNLKADLEIYFTLYCMCLFGKQITVLAYNIRFNVSPMQ